MNQVTRMLVLGTIAVACAGTALAGTTPLGSSFSYQGVLNSGGAPYNGTADIQFTLWEVASGPPQVASSGTLTANGVVVTNGVFSLNLNFGAAAFDGNERYLELAVHTPGNGGAGPFTTLTPRQKITAVPYAMYALNSLIAGTQANAIAFSNPTNTYAGSSMSLDGGTFHVDDVNNRVGIGTTTPRSTLEIVGTSFYQEIGPALGGFSGFSLREGTTIPGMFARLDNDIWVANGTAGGVILGTHTSSGVTADRLHVYPSGRIRMGTTNVGPEPTAVVQIFAGSSGVAMNPNSALALERNVNNYLNILAPNANETGVLFGKPTGGAEAGGIIYNTAGTPDGLQFRTGGNVPRMVVSSDGSVGIGGITVPAARFDVFNQDTSVLNTAIFRIATPGSNYSHVHNGANGDWYIRSAVNGGKVIIQDVPGNVGIGTSNPQAKLHVALGDVLVENGGVSLRENSTLIGSLQIGAPAELVLANYDAGDLAFSTGTTVGGPAFTRMSIKPSGAVGIGTLSPGTRLHIINSLGTQNALQADNNAPAGGGLASGVVGITNQANAFAGGVRGFNANSSGTGVIGSGNNLAPTTLAGGSGGAFTGVTTGLYANSTTIGSGEGLYTVQFGEVVRVNYWNGTQFKILGGGAVSTVVKDVHEQPVTMFAPEAPEVLFEDHGTGMLIGGFTHIDLDPTFAKNVLIDPLHPLRVYIQLEDNENCQGVIVKNKSATGFDVLELRGGRSNTPFQYHIVCTRADETLSSGRLSKYADLRFPPAPAPAPTMTAEGDPIIAGQVQPQQDVNPNPEG